MPDTLDFIGNLSVYPVRIYLSLACMNRLGYCGMIGGPTITYFLPNSRIYRTNFDIRLNGGLVATTSQFFIISRHSSDPKSPFPSSGYIFWIFPSYSNLTERPSKFIAVAMSFLSPCFSKLSMKYLTKFDHFQSSHGQYTVLPVNFPA